MGKETGAGTWSQQVPGGLYADRKKIPTLMREVIETKVRVPRR